MNILLDENLPKKLKYDFGTIHQVHTVRDKGWQGKKNGELLGLIVYSGIDIFVTTDKNLIYQQNISKFPVKIFVLDAYSNKHQVLQPYVEKLNKLLNDNIKQQVVVVRLT